MARVYCNYPEHATGFSILGRALRGLVLPVGGIKEKVLAAHRSRIGRVILPKKNEQDPEDVPEHVKDEPEFVFAKRIEDVLTAAIPDVNVAQQSPA